MSFTFSVPGAVISILARCAVDVIGISPGGVFEFCNRCKKLADFKAPHTAFVNKTSQKKRV